MNTKYLAIALVVIIVVAGALGYLAYNGNILLPRNPRS